MDAGADGGDDLGVGVAEDHGAPGTDVIDVALAIGVKEVGAAGALEEDRVAADAAEGAHRRVDAAGYVALGRGKEVVGSGHGGGSPGQGAGRGQRIGAGVGRPAVI